MSSCCVGIFYPTEDERTTGKHQNGANAEQAWMLARGSLHSLGCVVCTALWSFTVLAWVATLVLMLYAMHEREQAELDAHPTPATQLHSRIEPPAEQTLPQPPSNANATPR